jgi:hypothetical protein
MEINSFTTIKILMIRPSVMLGFLRLLHIIEKRDFTARKNMHRATGGRYAAFFTSITVNNTPEKEQSCCGKGNEIKLNY